MFNHFRLQEFNQKVVEAVFLCGPVSINMKTETICYDELGIELSRVDISFILDSVACSKPVERCEEEGVLCRCTNSTADFGILMNGIFRSARWVSGIVSRIPSREGVGSDTISYAEARVVVASVWPNRILPHSDFNGSVHV